MARTTKYRALSRNSPRRQRRSDTGQFPVSPTFSTSWLEPAATATEVDTGGLCCLGGQAGARPGSAANDVVRDSSGNLYIADQGNSRIRKSQEPWEPHAYSSSCIAVSRRARKPADPGFAVVFAW